MDSSTPQPMACQLQSPLVSLPGELRNKIYRHCLISDSPIVNPYFEPSVRPKHRQLPPVGTALSHSCRTVHNEIDISPLYTQNTFVFTRASHLYAFSKHLTREQTRWIRSVTIDLRESSLGYPNAEGLETADTISNEWLHYLSCNHYAHVPGIWCSRLTTLNSDYPDLKEIVIDMTEWQSPFAGTRKAGWKYLQGLLHRIKDMDSISLRAKCLDSSGWNPKPAPWSVGPWFSPAFSSDETSLLELLGAGVRGAEAGEAKVFSWDFHDGITSLRVKVQSSSIQEGLMAGQSLLKEIPAAGQAAWDAFLEFQAAHKVSDPLKLG